MRVGQGPNGNSQPFAGSIYYAEVRSGIGGTVVAKLDPSEKTDFDANWTSSTGEVWTVNRSGGSVADMRSSLTASVMQGLPAGGSSYMSYVDGVATYNFPNGSVSSGVPFLVGLGGFTNTSTAGSHTSNVMTYNNAGTPAIVDGPTASNSVTFDDNSTDVTAAIARSVTFTSDTDAISLLMDPGLSATSDRSHASTYLAIATNAGGGYDLYAKASTLTDGTYTLPRVASTDVTSGCVATGSSTTNRWGFTVAPVIQGGAGATAVRQGQLWDSGTRFCGHTTTDTKVVDQSAPSNGDTVALTTRAKVDYLQAAAAYTSTITYTATPSY